MVFHSNSKEIYLNTVKFLTIWKQGRTGHRSNVTLFAGALKISHTKGDQKRGILEEFWGPFDFFCIDGRRGLLIPVCFCLKGISVIFNWELLFYYNTKSAGEKKEKKLRCSEKVKTNWILNTQDYLFLHNTYIERFTFEFHIVFDFYLFQLTLKGYLWIP
jgi:hypothetical protein